MIDVSGTGRFVQSVFADGVFEVAADLRATVSSRKTEASLGE
jgi:hypothetical protein